MWTDEQVMAINESGKNIIVSAGAGSGKTAVLSERVIKKLENGIHVNELLILTFTKAAALEMKERIRKKIRDHDSIKGELDFLDSAYITTFDSFALSMVMKYHYVLNLNRDIGIIDGSVIASIKDKIMDEVFMSFYEKDDQDFLEFIDTFCVKDDQDIKKYVLDISNKLDMVKDRDSFLDELSSKYFDKDKVKENIGLFTGLIMSKINDIRDILSLNNSSFSDKLYDSFKGLFTSSCYDDVVNNINLSMPRICKSDTEEDKILKEEVNNIYKDIKGMCIYDSIIDIENGIYKTRDYVKVITRVIKCFNERVYEYKKRYNVYEFSDIAIMAIKLFEEHDWVREEVKNSFKEILLDEYQDTNDLQEEFISLISNNNVYMVGDIKQSIYRFRNANPSIFKNKYDNYRNNAGGMKIDLNKNFRSRKEVIKGINLIFNKVMDDMYGGCDYLKEHQMVFGNLCYDKEGSISESCELEVYNYDYDKEIGYTKDEIEAFIVAYDISNKISSGYKVFDKDEKVVRKAKYSDMVILLDRSANFDLFKRVFEYMNIPLEVYKDEKMTEDNDMLVITNLFRFIIKIKKEEYDKEFKYLFLSIGRSFLYRYSDEELFDIITNNKIKDTDIYTKSYNISKDIDNMSSSLVVDIIIDSFDYYNKLITIGNVTDGIVKVDKIKEMAKSTSKLGYTIYEYTEFLSDLIHNGYDITYSNQVGMGDCVKIMTIHKSKGLEFNICYFANLYKTFNIKEVTNRFLYDKKYGIITPYFDEGINHTIYKYLLKEDYINEEISEKIRLFYVALTRAKEKMIFINLEDGNLVDKKNKYRSFKDILSSIKELLKPFTKTISLEDVPLSKDYNLIKKSNYIKEIDLSIPKIEVEEIKLNYDILNKDSFSKKSNKIYTKTEVKNMEYGSYIHYVLEVADFKNIMNNDIEDQELIRKFLHHDLFNNINDANIYKEYEFVYEENNNIYHGIIDLMLEYYDYIDIVDYKLKDIDDENYIKQLKGYKNYIENKTGKIVNTYLYSIFNDEIKKIDF